MTDAIMSLIEGVMIDAYQRREEAAAIQREQIRITDNISSPRSVNGTSSVDRVGSARHYSPGSAEYVAKVPFWRSHACR